MTSASPVTIARPSRSNGVLSIPASATQKQTGQAAGGPASKAPLARLKIIIRRLSPGLTQGEFEEGLGDEWKVGGDKVDWAIFKGGKVSKDPAKPSKPSRAYLHLTKQEYIAPLSDNVRNTTFNDVKATFNDSALVGPPSVEFAPYGRVPNSRQRKDARQSTIDQDQEFIEFLESLTTPISKSAIIELDNDMSGKGKEKITLTPLVQYLKEKKANKGKEHVALSQSAKHARQESKDSKGSVAADNKSSSSGATASSPKKRSAQAVKVEQAARDAVKVLNKQAANTSKVIASTGQTPAASPSSTSAVASNSGAHAALANKKRERGNASAAAKILQRDLGLGGNTGRGGRRGPPGGAARAAASNATTPTKSTPGASRSMAATDADTPATAPIATATTAAPANANPTGSPIVPPVGPAAQRVSPDAPASSNSYTITSNNPSIPPKPLNPSSTATQAFLKHANPSQGITEPLLEEAFAVFGAIDKVEIDKKKGFAYVDFAEPESLQEAIRASPIKIAQGQVVVLERKTGLTLQARNARTSRPIMSNRGGGVSVGGRGGAIRVRGGYGRGAGNVHPPNNQRVTPAAANTASNAATTASAIPAAAPSTAESSTLQPAATSTAASAVAAAENS